MRKILPVPTYLPDDAELLALLDKTSSMERDFGTAPERVALLKALTDELHWRGSEFVLAADGQIIAHSTPKN